MAEARLLLLPGDGIGPEVISAARRVLEATARRFMLRLSFAEELIGGAALDHAGRALPASTLAACRHADAVLLGAVGGPRWDDPNLPERQSRGCSRSAASLAFMPMFARCEAFRLWPSLRRFAPNA